MKPNTAPTKSANGMASQAQLASVPPSHKKQKAKDTAQTETVPSIERSMDPIRMINVTPIATISAGEAAIKIRAKFLTVKKRGSITAKNNMRTKRTKSGAHFTSTSRLMPCVVPSDRGVSVTAIATSHS